MRALLTTQKTPGWKRGRLHSLFLDPFPEVLEKAIAASFSKEEVERIFISMKGTFVRQLLDHRHLRPQILNFIRNNHILSRLIDFCLQCDEFDYPHFIALLAEEDTGKLIVTQFQEGTLSREWVHRYLISVGRKDQSLMDKHLAALNEGISPPFERPGEAYFNPEIGKAVEEQKLKATKALFFNKEKFVEMVRSVFDEFGVDKFPQRGIIFRAHSDYLKENELREKYPRFILHLINDNPLMDKFELIEKIETNWEWVSIRELKKYLDFQKEVKLNESEINYVKSWCDKHAGSFLSGQNPTCGDIHFTYYALKFEFRDYPADTYLKMVGAGIQNKLSFGMTIITFIEKHNLVAPASLEKKVLDNLENQKAWGELMQHFDYIKKKKIKKAAPILKTYIESPELGTRQNALYLYQELGGDIDYLLDLTLRFPPNDALESGLIEILILQRPDEILELLKERFSSSQVKAEKLRYAKQMIRLNQPEGLKYLIHYAETEKKYPFDTLSEEMNFHFYDPKGIPLFLRLFNLGNDPSIPQDGFNNLSRFARSILFHMALYDEGRFFDRVYSYAIRYQRFHSLLNKLPTWIQYQFHPAFSVTLDQLKYFLKDLQRAYARGQKMELQEALSAHKKLI